MKKLLLLLLLSFGLIGQSFALSEVSITYKEIYDANLEKFQQKLADEKAAAASSTTAYQQRLLGIEATCGSYSFDLQVASVERLKVEIKTLIKQLEVEKKTLIKQLEVERKTLIKQLEELRIENYKNLSEINDVKLDIYLLSVEIDEAVKSEPGLNSSVQSLEDLHFRGIVCSIKTAKLEDELAAQEMMAEIEAEMARQAALEAFYQKLIDNHLDEELTVNPTIVYVEREIVVLLCGDLIISVDTPDITSNEEIVIDTLSYIKLEPDDPRCIEAKTNNE
jgi:hypothetical protein